MPSNVFFTPARRRAVIAIGLMVVSPTGAQPAKAPAESGSALFVDAAAQAGIDFVHFNGMSGDLLFPEMMGAGCALFDYDGDGDLDAYLVQGHMLGKGKTVDDALIPPAHPLPLTDRLYRNDCPAGERPCRTLRFTDVTDASGLSAAGYGMGVAAGDIDNDGDLDLYVMNYGDNQLWRNEGNGRFTDVTAAAGVNDARWSFSASFVDIDADGWLDLYVGNYLKHDLDDKRECRLSTRVRDYCGPLRGAGEKDSLFRNLGNGRFEDISEASGITRAWGGALGVSTADFNGDGRIDIYVANDGLANQLWLNQGDRRFVDDALLAGVSVNRDGTPEASMGVDAADFDGDGDIDLFMTHLRQETNTLYVNDGQGWFEDRSIATGVAGPSFAYTGFGTAWFDYDNDGWLDILAVNGAVKKIEKLVIAGDPYPLHQLNQLFHNLGGGRYTEVTASAGPAFALSEVSRGTAFGDVDNDGDVDALVTNNAGPARLLINQVGQGAGWLGVELRDGRRDALGARAVVRHDDGRALWRQVRSDGSYASANDPRLVFGLGPRAPDSAGVTVLWPDGTTERWDDLATNRYHRLRRGTGRAATTAETDSDHP